MGILRHLNSWSLQMSLLSVIFILSPFSTSDSVAFVCWWTISQLCLHAKNGLNIQNWTWMFRTMTSCLLHCESTVLWYILKINYHMLKSFISMASKKIRVEKTKAFKNIQSCKNSKQPTKSHLSCYRNDNCKKIKIKSKKKLLLVNCMGTDHFFFESSSLQFTWKEEDSHTHFSIGRHGLQGHFPSPT